MDARFDDDGYHVFDWNSSDSEGSVSELVADEYDEYSQNTRCASNDGKYAVGFSGGEASRHPDRGCDFMDVTFLHDEMPTEILVEYVLPELPDDLEEDDEDAIRDFWDNADDEAYKWLKLEMTRRCAAYGLTAEQLQFWQD
jgi:hypothetical protein